MKKKLLSIFLVIVLVLSTFPVTVSAENDITSYLTYEITDGNVTITRCDNSISGDIVIPDTIEGYPVKAIDGFGFYDCYYINSIVIPDSVETICSEAFFNCGSMTKITLSNNLKTIDSYAFKFCDSLENITIPSSVTFIGADVFKGCTSLSNITVEKNNNFYSSDTSGVLFTKDRTELIQYPVGNSRTEYSIPNSVTTIDDYAFYSCDNLTGITIPNSVTTIGVCAFAFCRNLTSIFIPDSVTRLAYSAFEHCFNLEYIEVDKSNELYSSDIFGVLFNKDRTDLIQYPVGNSRAEYIIPDTVQTINQYAFYSCDYIINISVPESVTTIGVYAFDIYSLQQITIWNPNCTIIDIYGDTLYYQATIYGYEGSTAHIYAEQYERNFIALEQPNEPEHSILDWLYYEIVDEKVIITGCDNSISGDIVIPSTIEGYPVTAIGDYAFLLCNNITSIVIPEGVSIIGQWAFYDCTNLTSIFIPQSVISIGEAAFNYCDNLTSIIVDETNTCYSSDEYGVLFNKTKTELICFPKANIKTDYQIPNGVISINADTFYNNDNITSITIPDSVTTIGDAAFYSCNNLNNITIGAGVISVGESAFYACTKLENLILPDSLKSIDDWAFAHCNTITTTSIGKNVEAIGEYAFYNCHNMKSITIPANITKISNNAFELCNALTDVYYAGTETKWKSVEIGSNNDSLVNAIIHYSDCTHIYTYEITTPATHLTEGLKTFTCSCGDSYTQPIEKINAHEYIVVVTVPTCSEKGFTTYKCECGDNYVSDFIEVLEHTDNDGDNCCDNCKKEIYDASNSSKNCSHLCHKSGISGFFWKIIKFFWKLFKMNPSCECGVAHY